MTAPRRLLASLAPTLALACSLGAAAPSAVGAPASRSTASKYVLLPDVTLSPKVERQIARTAEVFFAQTGKPLVVTSGRRDALDQARAMHQAIRLGANVERLYRNKTAIRELLLVVEASTAAKKSVAAIDEDLAEAIEAQVRRGVFISAHLRDGAVDVRSRGMSEHDKRAFLEGVAKAGGMEVIAESAPPHFHLQFEQ